MKAILIICADGLTGIKEAIAAAFQKTEHQRCIVHQVRNTLKYVSDKDRKAFATDLKTIYKAADEKKALAALDQALWRHLSGLKGKKGEALAAARFRRFRQLGNAERRTNEGN